MQFAIVLPLVVAILASFLAAIVDARTFHIPNALTFPLLCGGLLYGLVAGGWAGLAESGSGLLSGGLIMLSLFIVGAMGAGDVKLMAGLGAWLGPSLTIYVFVVAALATGGYSLFLLARQHAVSRAFVAIRVVVAQLATIGRFLGAADQVEAAVVAPDRRKRLVPFAVMVALGVASVFVWKLLY